MRALPVWVGFLLVVAGCLGGAPSEEGSIVGPGDASDLAGFVVLPGATIATPQGTITIVLYPDLAPATVAQFTELARSGWYDGSIFHRTVDNFVIQGGGTPEGKQDAGTIPLEPGGYFAAGALGIARTEEPDSGTSQYFIDEYPQPHLRDPDLLQSPLGYTYGPFTVFGQVVDGMDVVRAINDLPHDASGEDRPLDPPPMTVVVGPVTLDAQTASELPYRTWGRFLAPPHRLSLESPGTLIAGEPTWMRLYIEDQADRGASTGVTPTVQVARGTEAPLPLTVTTFAQDTNIHEITLTFPAPGAYTVTVLDGPRPLTTFDVRAT